MAREELRKAEAAIHGIVNKEMSKVVVGQYTGEKEPHRSEGDEWLDRDGKMWEMKDGIKRSITKLQDAKTPWWCPVCEKTLNRTDDKFMRIRGKCHDCVLGDEHKIRIGGRWRDYSDMKEMRNQLAWLKDRLIEVVYYHDTLSSTEVRSYDEETGALLMVDKFSIDLDTVRDDLQREGELINTSLNSVEKEYIERFGGLPGDETDEFKELVDHTS